MMGGSGLKHIWATGKDRCPKIGLGSRRVPARGHSTVGPPMPSQHRSPTGHSCSKLRGGSWMMVVPAHTPNPRR